VVSRKFVVVDARWWVPRGAEVRRGLDAWARWNMADERVGGSRRALGCGVVSVHSGAGVGGGGSAVESTHTGAPEGTHRRSHRPCFTNAPCTRDHAAPRRPLERTSARDG